MSILLVNPLLAQDKIDDVLNNANTDIYTNNTTNDSASIQKVYPKKSFNMTIETGIDRYFGYTLYQIGGIFSDSNGAEGTLHYPLSELKFPLDVWMINLNFKFNFLKKYLISFGTRLNINGNRTFSGDDYAGKMEDSDWGLQYLNNQPGAKPDSLDIYSTSDAALFAAMANFSFKYIFYTKSFFSISAGGHFLYQHFYYEIRNLEEEYPSTGQPDLKISGKVLTYKVQYFIPCIIVSPAFKISNEFDINLDIGLSPFTYALDEDDHILRSKWLEGKSNGYTFLIDLEVLYRFSSGFFAAIKGDFLVLQTDGEQTQKYYNSTSEAPEGYTVKIENSLEAMQGSIGLRFGFNY